MVYYAMGGGLGHLTRARAVLHTLAVEGPVTLLSASPHAADPRVRGACEVVAPTPDLAFRPAAYRAWLRGVLDRLRPAVLVLDAFPAGLRGEWDGFPIPKETEVWHVARRLRWRPYSALLAAAPPRLHRTFVVEPLARAHAAFLEAVSEEVESLRLEDPPGAAPSAPGDPAAAWGGGRPRWLIVHSGPAAETRALLDLARAQAAAEEVAPSFVLVTPGPPGDLPSGVEVLDAYPAHPLFPFADRIVTAAGFNAMRQAAPYRARHLYRPFRRRFDDQPWRAAQAALDATG